MNTAISCARRSSASIPKQALPLISVRHRSKAAYPGHVPLSGFEQGFLAVGSAIASLVNPYRHDMVATLGETTAGPWLHKLRVQMLAVPDGRILLQERPRITTKTVDLPYLQSLPEGTFGRAYADWLAWCKVTPDTRDPVRFIDDPELAYVMQRYRECHDFYHVITGPFSVSVAAELVVKWFELANFGLPVAALSGVFGPLRLSGQGRRRLIKTYVPWAVRCGANASPLINVYWEKMWEKDIEEMRKELNIEPPPISWAEYRKTGAWK